MDPICIHATDVSVGPLHLRRLCAKRNNANVAHNDCLACKGLPPSERSEPVLEPVKEPTITRPDLQFNIPNDGKPHEFALPIILSNGSITYEKTGWEPPRTINGYVRDLTNKWLFHPLWPVCAKRVGRAFIRGECGCVQVEMRCGDKIVYDSDCRRCENGVRM